MPNQYDTSDSETWGAYRKLVVETLRRLDERTLKMNDTQNKQESRIFVIEQKRYDDRLDDLDESVATIEKKMSEQKGRQGIIMIIAGGIWGIAVLLINAMLDGKLIGN